jgi:hypothetical protein
MSCAWTVRSLVPRHRSKAALFPVAGSGVVFSSVEPLCFVCVFFSGRGYYVLPRQRGLERALQVVPAAIKSRDDYAIRSCEHHHLD